MDVGSDLRKARIAGKRSVEEIARATKITPALLRAIENDAFDRVPGGLFTRGYLRAYAREVGLDGEALVRRYRAEYEPVPAVSESKQGEPTELERERLGWVRQTVPLEDQDPSSTKKVLVELCVVLLVVTLYFVGWRRSAATRAPDVKPIAALGVTPADNAAPPVPPPPIATTGAAQSAEPTLEIHPTGDCWVEATQDGERVITRLMTAGDRQSMPIRGDVKIRVGDPAAFGFSIDGVAGRTVGTAGRPVTLHVNARNYREFLAGHQ